VRFLRHLLRHILGKLLVIWDGAPIHRCQAVKDFLAQGAAHRLHLEPLPGYAPDVNPDEGLFVGVGAGRSAACGTVGTGRIPGLPVHGTATGTIGVNGGVQS
jgi:hypothetical protein